MPRGTILKVREQRIIGLPFAVQDVLLAAQVRGDFVSCTRPEWLDDGRVVVVAKLIEPNQPRPRPRRIPRIAAVVAAGALAVLGLLGWLVVTTVTALGRWVGDHTAEVAVGVVVLLLVLARLGRQCEITVIHRRH